MVDDMIGDYFVLALKSIRHKSTRSYLTIIGILIGVAAIVALVSLTQGLSESVEAEFETAGVDTITVMADTGPGLSPAINTYLDEGDVEVIESVRGVDSAEPMNLEIAEVTFRGETETTFIFGGTPNIYEVFPQFQVRTGRELRENDRSNAIIGDTVYPAVFDEPVDLRNNIEIRGESFSVVGVLESLGNPTDDQSITIPIQEAQRIFNKEGEISMVYVSVDEGFEVAKVAEDIEETLEEQGRDDEYSVETMEQMMEAVNNILAMVQGLFIGVASISLLVGGVGIMNTMYTSVLEKTKEIGIMKAVGARNSNVMTVFMIESGLLGLGGGMAGVALGLGIAKTAEYVVQEYAGLGMLSMSVTPQLIIGALMFSFVLGTISGVLPARRAAGLDPVDALRAE